MKYISFIAWTYHETGSETDVTSYVFDIWPPNEVESRLGRLSLTSYIVYDYSSQHMISYWLNQPFSHKSRMITAPTRFLRYSGKKCEISRHVSIIILYKVETLGQKEKLLFIKHVLLLPKSCQKSFAKDKDLRDYQIVLGYSKTRF